MDYHNGQGCQSEIRLVKRQHPYLRFKVLNIQSQTRFRSSPHESHTPVRSTLKLSEFWRISVYNSLRPQPTYLPTTYSAAPEVVSVGSRIVTFFLLAITVVGIVFMFYSFSSSTQPSRKNYARANLILFAAFLVLWLLPSLTGLNIFGTLLRSGSSQ
jgi:hypothetical protein